MSSIKLYQGDCLEIMKDIPDKSVDCVITDPPYEIETTGGDCIRTLTSNILKN